MDTGKASDAVVEVGDLLSAIDEIKRGEGPEIMKRLWQVEPQLTAYIEAAAAHLAGTVKQQTGKDTVTVMDELLDYSMTLVRAIEMGHSRLWRDILPLPPNGGEEKREKR